MLSSVLRYVIGFPDDLMVFNIYLLFQCHLGFRLLLFHIEGVFSIGNDPYPLAVKLFPQNILGTLPAFSHEILAGSVAILIASHLIDGTYLLHVIVLIACDHVLQIHHVGRHIHRHNDDGDEMVNL